MERSRKYLNLKRELLDSEAFRSLDPYARCLLIEILYRFSGSNNGYLIMSHDEGCERVGCSMTPIRRAFDILEERGFIKARVRGAFTVKNRQATEWIITTESYNGTPPTKDFLKWRADSDGALSMHCQGEIKK